MSRHKSQNAFLQAITDFENHPPDPVWDREGWPPLDTLLGFHKLDQNPFWSKPLWNLIENLWPTENPYRMSRFTGCILPFPPKFGRLGNCMSFSFFVSIAAAGKRTILERIFC